jgi:hypothetical protein
LAWSAFSISTAKALLAVSILSLSARAASIYRRILAALSFAAAIAASPSADAKSLLAFISAASASLSLLRAASASS